MTKDELLSLMRSEIEKAGGRKAWAEKHGLSQPYVSDVLRGNRLPGPSILQVLGLEKVATVHTYERINDAQAR